MTFNRYYLAELQEVSMVPLRASILNFAIATLNANLLEVPVKHCRFSKGRDGTGCSGWVSIDMENSRLFITVIDPTERAYEESNEKRRKIVALYSFTFDEKRNLAVELAMPMGLERKKFAFNDPKAGQLETASLVHMILHRNHPEVFSKGPLYYPSFQKPGNPHVKTVERLYRLYPHNLYTFFRDRSSPNYTAMLTNFCLEIVNALSLLHRTHFHCMIKPGNILIERDSQTGMPRALLTMSVPSGTLEII
jgi:hypothetical protein